MYKPYGRHNAQACRSMKDLNVLIISIYLGKVDADT
jgi:hypothetical protein